jgi:arginase family enzyme
MKKIVFFGCPLDSDERGESVKEKLAFERNTDQSDDPYDFVMQSIRQEAPRDLWDEKGSLAIPEWLRPIPLRSEWDKMLVDNFVAFIDSDGCREFADAIGELVANEIYPDIPCMVAVDHSLTGGVYARLAELYAPEEVSLIVLDSHVDAIPASIISEAIQYDMETNPKSDYDPDDPFLWNRPNSYNASSFLHYLLAERKIRPENLYLIGISDYPPAKAFRIKDRRIKNYVGRYSSLKREGVKMITKNDLSLNPSKIKNLFNQINTPYVYVSIDMDVGARNAVEGVRFRDWRGIGENRLFKIAHYLQEITLRKSHLVGVDITEFNPRRAVSEDSNPDRTYRIAANLLKVLCFGM